MEHSHGNCAIYWAITIIKRVGVLMTSKLVERSNCGAPCANGVERKINKTVGHHNVTFILSVKSTSCEAVNELMLHYINCLIIYLHILARCKSERTRWSESCVLIGYPSGQGGPILPAQDFPHWSARRFSFWSFKKSFIGQACSVSRWLDVGLSLAFLSTLTSSRSRSCSTTNM